MSRSCLLMLLNHQLEDREHGRVRIVRAGLAHRQSQTFWGQPAPSNGLTAARSTPCSNISNGITHVWSVCAMELMDSSRKNSIWTKKKDDMEDGARWDGLQIRPSCNTAGNTHLPPNVPQHNFKTSSRCTDRDLHSCATHPLTAAVYAQYLSLAWQFFYR